MRGRNYSPCTTLERMRRLGCVVGHSEVALLIAEKQALCSGRLKRTRDTFLPLLEHAIAYLHEFRVRFNVGLQIL
jgi:hypothetical protein